VRLVQMPAVHQSCPQASYLSGKVSGLCQESGESSLNSVPVEDDSLSSGM
jgi:hypothetical protein